MYMPGWAMGACMLIGSWLDGLRVRARTAVARDWPSPRDRWASWDLDVTVAEVGPRDGRLSVLVHVTHKGEPPATLWLSMADFQAHIRGTTLMPRGGDHA